MQLLDAAKASLELSVDTFNRVRNPYRNEGTLILLTNGWELLAKAILVQQHEPITKGRRGERIAAEVAIARLQNRGLLDKNQSAVLQQIVSLRNAATHHLLPGVPDEVMHHLLFFACKFFREAIGKMFPSHLKDLSGNYLSLSFSDLTTYADRIQRAVSRVKKSASDKRLVWLLERGIEFDGSAYLTEKQFEQKYRDKKKIMPHLAVSKFIRDTEMVRIVPVQAPKNFTADITLRKGSTRDASLPVVVKKTELEEDYPYLTKELAGKVDKTQNWAAKAAAVLKLKGDPKYHQSVRTSTSGAVQRYSEAAVQQMKALLAADPGFNPYSAS